MNNQRSFWSVIFSTVLLLTLLFGQSKSASGGPDLTPLTLAGSLTGLHINEVMFKPGSGGYEWVEIKNFGPSNLEISGFGLTDENNHWYVFPTALPPVPVGGFVVVMLDGKGSTYDDYNFNDSVATLHSQAGLTNILGDDAGQVAIYDTVFTHISNIFLPALGKGEGSAAAKPIAQNHEMEAPQLYTTTAHVFSFVAWGAAPGIRANLAASAGIWDGSWFVTPFRSLGYRSSAAKIGSNRTIGLLKNSVSSYPENWIYFQSHVTTQGKENITPTIAAYFPPDKATVDKATLSIAWETIPDATSYTFQLSSNVSFLSPSVNVTRQESYYVSPTVINPGKYYWRVKVTMPGSESNWSAPVEINTAALASITGSDNLSDYPDLSNLSSHNPLGVRHQMQRKDTLMLDISGSPETGSARWDNAHATKSGLLDGNYCARASVAMVAEYYGGHLSQDRISYEIKGNRWWNTTFSPGPEGDLGYGDGFTALVSTNNKVVVYDETLEALKWALNSNNVTRRAGKPTFDQIRQWIDEDRPIIAGIDNHVFVIDGYNAATNSIHVLDPASSAGGGLHDYDDTIQILEVYYGPAGKTSAPNVRSDEDANHNGIADTIDDSDGDLISNFDEQHRFPGLSSDNPDSDQDGVNDKQEIREYTFNDAGMYSPRRPDIDNDGMRKEVDPDNDNGGATDGAEDANGNGRYEVNQGETNNFAANDDKPDTVPQKPPYPPSNPNPPIGVKDQSLNIVLTWQGGDPNKDKVTYSVYLEANNDVPNTLVCKTETTSCTPGTLKPLTKYFWRILARDEHGMASSSPLMSFTTGSGENHPPNLPTEPNPSDQSTISQLKYTLSWKGGDQDGDAVTYSVLFGTPNPPQTQLCFYTPNQTCSTGTLAPSTTYFWRVIAHDEHGANTTGTVWRFTTGAVPPGQFSKVSPPDGDANQPTNVTLDWEDSQGATGYAYCIGPSTSCSSWISTGTTSQVTVSGLLGGRTYWWQVRATNSAGTIYANGSSANFWRFTIRNDTANITMDQAFTVHYFSDEPRTTFRPGEAVTLALTATNHTTQSLQVAYNWDTYNPSNARVPYLSYGPWNSTMASGTKSWFLDRGIPANSPAGQYRYTAKVTYGSVSSEKATNFTVQGTPISITNLMTTTCRSVTNNKCSGETNTFTPADPYVNVWSAWEGSEGAHSITWDWYRPDNSLLGSATYDFNGTEPLWNTWSTASIANGTNYGEWSVKIYMDGVYVLTQYFTYVQSSSSDNTPPAGTVGENAPRSGGGSAVGEGAK